MSGSYFFTGTLDLLILSAVAHEPRHVYAIGTPRLFSYAQECPL